MNISKNNNINKFKNSYHPYAAITILFWSFAYVLTRLSLEYFTAFSLGFLRYFIASCTLAVTAFITKMKLPGKKDIPWFFAAGSMGFFIYMLTFNQGQAMVTAATGSLVIATVPVITALLARVIFQEQLKPYQWTAIAISFFGVTVLALMKGGFSVNGGLFWLILAALSLSVYNLLQRKLTKTYSAMQTSTYSIFFGILLLSIFAPSSFRGFIHAPARQMIYLGILGVCSSAIAYVSWAKAFSKAKQTSQVSNYMFITPFLTGILGFLLAGEIPDPATIIGGGIILIGLMIFNFGDILFA